MSILLTEREKRDKCIWGLKDSGKPYRVIADLLGLTYGIVYSVCGALSESDLDYRDKICKLYEKTLKGNKCYGCKRIFYHRRCGKNIHANIQQKPIFRLFCSKKCKIKWIYSIIRSRNK